MMLSFSQFYLLMSTPKWEKDSLLGQVLHVQNPSAIFGQFFLDTLYIIIGMVEVR